MGERELPKIEAAMNAVRLSAPGGPANLVYEQVKTPEPATGQVLVRVHAAAITRDELDWPVDRLPAIPSYEFSGVAAAVGPGVDGIQVGQVVYALCPFDRDGAAAEYAVVSSEFVAAKPETLDHVETAAIPLAALSAWQGLLDHGHLERGQRVLIHGAAGGVGHLAVQLAHHWGAHVIGTVSSANVQAVRKAGVDEVIDYTATRFEEVAGQVDLVFDTAGGDRLARSPAVVRPGGRLVSIATEPPKDAEAARGITALYFVVKPNGKRLAEITRLVESGVLRPTIDHVFALADARHAFERSLGSHGAGKIVLRVMEK
ncbi:MAG: NADP-dependent oxidoreductase [Chloroflexi bacterium]|nr:NADP-dependent oxidoreductase [Chloroflexota bacterium]